MPGPVSIVIPSYNGIDLLKAHIPSVLAALESYRPGGEIIVVDDGSSDGSIAWLEARAPALSFLSHGENLGFARACATGIGRARHPHVILLNSDVEVLPGFIEPLLTALEGDDVFAVQSLSLEEDRTGVDENVKVPRFSWGKLKLEKFRDSSIEEVRKSTESPCPTLFATGGFLAVKRALFRELGGFDPLFEPYYYEDLDLCYRAWKRGRRVLFQPASAVVHRHRSGTILTHNRKERVLTVMERNRLLFTWKNITAPRLFWARHVLPLFLKALFKWIVFDFRFYRALFGALGRTGPALAGRKIEKRDATRGDEEIFRIIRDAAPRGIR